MVAHRPPVAKRQFEARSATLDVTPPEEKAPPPDGFSWGNQYTFDADLVLDDGAVEEDEDEDEDAENAIPLDLESLSRKDLQAVASP